MQVLYADVLFIIDFSMDVVSLWLTSKLTNCEAKTYRLTLAACFGAFVSTVSTVTCLSAQATIILNIACSLVMCLISFGKGKVTAFIKKVVCLWLVGMLVGGVMTALVGMGKGRAEHPSLDSTKGGLILILPFGSAVSYLFVNVLSRFKAKRCVTVKAKILGVSYEFDGIVDSGNFLTEPISGSPVIVVLYCENDDTGGFANLLLNPERFSEHELAKRYRMIPAGSVFGEGVLPAVRPDEMWVNGSKVKAYLAVGKNSVNDKNSRKAIVPAVLIN